MASAFESWSRGFPFSKEVSALETSFQEEAPIEMPAPALPEQFAQDTPFIDHLSEKIAQKLSETIPYDEFLQHQAHMRELETDNIAMAQQLDALKRLIKDQDRELYRLRQQLHYQHQFHQVFGKFYIRLD